MRLYYLPEMFLSGRLFPLALLPAWAASLSWYTPFRFTIAFPLDILLGYADATAIAVGLLAQVGWIVLMSVAARVLWRSGLRLYTGVGM
jgi:ABC-2 type transport system permease protein